MSTAQPKPISIPTLSFNTRLVLYQFWTFSIHFFFTLVVFGLQVAPGLILKAIFDAAENGSSRFSDTPHEPWDLFALYIGLQLVVLAASLGADWYGWTFRFTIGSLLKRNLLASIIRRNGENSLPVSPGEAINRFRTDVGEVADFPTWLPDQAGKIIAAFIAIAIMARINLSITTVIFIPLILIMVVTRLAWGRIIYYNRLTSRATDAVTGFLGEAFRSVQAVKVANAEVDMVRHFKSLNNARREAAMKEKLFWGLLDTVNSSAVTFGISVILLMAGSALRTGSFTVGDFALFTFYLWFTTQVPSELGTFYGDYKTQEVSIERMLEMVRPEPVQRLVEFHPIFTRGSAPAPVYIEKKQADILERLDVQGLCYRHRGKGQGIQDITISLAKGTYTVVTGRVGSGKSTLLRTMLGLLTRDSGEIYWNGTRVEDPAAHFQPPHCAYTSQVPRLFSDTLKENILMGLPEGDVNLQQALWLSVFQEDVARLANGLDTLVGPRGTRLSGGQIQRAAAARMYVRQPELLVFDDLSSALDVETEKLLWERLFTTNADGKAPTCLVASHRRAALRKADHILVLKDGHIDDEGSLDELLDRCEEMRIIWTGELN